MSSWKTKAIENLRRHVKNGTVRWTTKATREFTGLGLTEPAAFEIVESFTVEDLVGCITSETSGEELHVFKTLFDELMLYVKIAFRAECVVISFHEDNGGFADD